MEASCRVASPVCIFFFSQLAAVSVRTSFLCSLLCVFVCVKFDTKPLCSLSVSVRRTFTLGSCRRIFVIFLEGVSPWTDLTPTVKH